MRYRRATNATVEDERQGRPLLPEILLAVGLSLLTASVVRAIAPPSLIRDGQRLPVGLSGQHGMLAGHHGGGLGGATAPSPVSDHPVQHFLGSAFLAVHVLAVVLIVGALLICRLLTRLRLQQAKFGAQLMFATVAATATAGTVALAARLGYGDRLPVRDAFLGGVDAARYAFVAALVFAVIFGFPWKESTVRSGV
jgi:hypothetical protein